MNLKGVKGRLEKRYSIRVGLETLEELSPLLVHFVQVQHAYSTVTVKGLKSQNRMVHHLLFCVYVQLVEIHVLELLHNCTI